MEEDQHDNLGELPPTPNRRYLGHSSSSSDPLSATTRSSSLSFAGPSDTRSNVEEPFTMKYSEVDENFLAEKMIFPVGIHSIAQMYEAIREEMRMNLRDIAWYTIDVLRIGYSPTAQDNPVVVLVTVKERSTAYVKGQEAVNLGRKVLFSRGLEDVHVEMKEGVGLSQSMGGLPVEAKRPKTPYEQLSRLGQSIGPNSVKASGSLGLYMTVQNGAQSDRYGLTCHHVVFAKILLDPPAGFGASFDPVSSSKMFKIDQPTTKDHEALVEYLEAKVEDLKTDLEDFLEKQRNAQDGTGKELNQWQLTRINNLPQELQEVERTLVAIQSFDRSFGSVILTSGLRVDKNDNDADWALIKLDRTRFTTVPENIVPDFDFRESDLEIMNKNLKDTKDKFREGINTTTHVTETLPLAEILNPLAKDKNEKPILYVLKYGRTTHWTVGLSNNMFSDCRYDEGRGDKTTTEWCIVDIPEGKRFSRLGDSGCPVVDLRSRIGGILHGCGRIKSGENEGMACAYVTPIDWLMDSIQETLKPSQVSL